MNALASVIATAIEATRLQDEERIRQIVREELEHMQVRAPEAGWMSAPQAKKARGLSLKRIYKLMAERKVEMRAKNPDSAHPKWEINLRSLDAALSGDVVQEPVKPVNATAWAAARERRKAATP